MADSTSPRRRPAEGGYVRGAETRERIIKAALKVFGEVGYAEASTRQIAATAGITPPALQYHFDSKEGLHRACGDALAARISELLREPLDASDQALFRGGAAEAREALCKFLDHILSDLIAGEFPDDWRLFLARAHGEEAPAFQVVRAAAAPALGRCAELVARSLGKPAPEEESRLIAVLLTSQLGAFGARREASLAAIGWTTLGPSERSALRRALRRMVLGATTPGE